VTQLNFDNDDAISLDVDKQAVGLAPPITVEDNPR
jgi:hypothetical protein